MQVIRDGNDLGNIEILPTTTIGNLKQYFITNFAGYNVNMTFSNGVTLDSVIWKDPQYDNIDLQAYANVIKGGRIILFKPLVVPQIIVPLVVPQIIVPQVVPQPGEIAYVYPPGYGNDIIHVLVDTEHNDAVWGRDMNNIMRHHIMHKVKDFFEGKPDFVLEKEFSPETVKILKKAWRREPFNVEDIDQEDRDYMLRTFDEFVLYYATKVTE